MKVLNGLVITLDEEMRFLCVWLFYYVSNFADSRTEMPRYRSSQSYCMRSFFFCPSVFSSSEVLGKITSIRSERSPLGPVNTNPFSNENGAVLLRIRLSSTLQR